MGVMVMINDGYRLSVDDLIVEYMIMKIKMGYYPWYMIDEFMDFVLYFEGYKKIDDVLYDGDRLFNRFFERKIGDWSFNDISLFFSEKKYVPHMFRDGSRIVATNKLGRYDDSLLNIYFMSDSEQNNIRNIIVRYLNRFKKRDLCFDFDVSDRCIELGEYISARFICSLWREYVYKYIDLKRWPIQCRNINEYLLDIDLASIINLPSIRDDVISFYRDVSKKISFMIEEDNCLEIMSSDNVYLPYANYEYIFNGYRDLFDSMCRDCYFEVIVGKNLFIENCCYMDDYRRRVRSKIDDDSTRELIKRLK